MLKQDIAKKIKDIEAEKFRKGRNVNALNDMNALRETLEIDGHVFYEKLHTTMQPKKIPEFLLLTETNWVMNICQI